MSRERLQKNSRTPQEYNAAVDLIGRNLSSGRANKVAIIDDHASYTYSELADRVHRCANALRDFGLEPEHRVVLCLFDSIDFPTCFLGAIHAGIVPIPVSTMATAEEYAWILADSQAKAAIVSDARMPVVLEATRLADWRGRVIVPGPALLATASGNAEPAPTQPGDVCFWLYSSGSTGKPKAAVHIQTSMIQTAELCGQQTLGFREDDVVYSAAKLFFAYGLGNALSFPMSVGGTSILFQGRPTAEAVIAILRQRRPTILCAVPTLFNSLLASPDLPARGEHSLRFCSSAGEALPESVGLAWLERTGVDLVDGIGSTEMLQAFVSNRPGSVRYGVTGRAVPGYRVRLVDEDDKDVPAGEIGEMLVSGPSAAICYWNDPERTRRTFQGEWVRTGDKFRRTGEGDYVYCGRSDDMLKVGGLWVSPLEVESALLAHEAVFEAAVVGAAGQDALIKPKAFIVLRQGVDPGPGLVQALQDFVKSRLAPYKYPRWIEFVDALPKTTTGKLQRFLLRQRP